MDPLTSYKLMTERFYDSFNEMTHVPPELYDYFQNLGKGKRIKKDKYKNFDQFIETCISHFINTTSTGNYKDLSIENPLYLQKDDGHIKFKITADLFELPFSLKFQIPDKKGGGCLDFNWYPFSKTIYLESMLFDLSSKKKIDPNKECDVSNIPLKAGEFFLEVIEDIGKKLGVEKIILLDASYIFIDNLKVSLAFMYLKNKDTTYYGKFGYKPVKFKIMMMDILFNIPPESAEDELKYVKNQLKKMKDLDLKSNIRQFQKLSKYLPGYYEKKI
jgi:hypothetical protein